MGIFSHAFGSVELKALEAITVGPTCRLRKIVSLRDGVPSCQEDEDLPPHLDFLQYPLSLVGGARSTATSLPLRHQSDLAAILPPLLPRPLPHLPSNTTDILKYTKEEHRKTTFKGVEKERSIFFFLG